MSGEEALQVEVVAEHGPEITDAALRSMRFAEAVVKETLRLEGPTQIVFRRATADIDISGYHIRKGEKLLMNLGHVVAADERWAAEDPGAFKPERWLCEAGHRTGAWVPFGLGPRMCSGMPLALNEMRVMVAVLARGYSFELLEPGERWRSFPLMTPAHGMLLRFSALQALQHC